jgi:hypothetical protein
MTTYDGPATVRQGESEVAVECGFAVRAPGLGRGTWSGEFVAGELGLVSGEAVLVLPNGASARIVIDSITFDGPAAISGRFVGAGPPPGG